MSAALLALTARAARINALSYASFYAGVIYNAPFFYYRLGETSAVSYTMSDSSGNSKHGTYNTYPSGLSTTGLVTGDADTAIDFAETTANWCGYTYPDSSGPTNVSGGTAQAYIYASGPHAANGGGVFLSLCNDGPGSGNLACPELVVIDFSPTHFKLQINSPGSGTVFLSSTTWPYGVKHLIHLRVNAGGLSGDLFVNGIFEANITTGGFLFSSIAGIAGGKLTIGGANYSTRGDYPFNGVVDEVALYPRPLLTNEISAFTAVM